MKQRMYDMKYLVEQARKHDWYDETCEDHCDFCGHETITTSFNVHDVFLEDWKRSLACINCAEEFKLVSHWIKWNELKEFGASDEQLEGFEIAVYLMVDIMVNVYNVKAEK
jgi:hypothetical protein